MKNFKKNKFENFFYQNELFVEKMILMRGDASDRRYARIFDKGQSKILMDDQNSKNIEKFIKIGKFLKSLGLSVPEIYFKDINKGLVLLEDFGEETFSSHIKNNEYYDYLYESAIDVLIKIQHAHVPKNLDFFSESRILKEVSIFIDWTIPYYFGREISYKSKKKFLTCWAKIAKDISLNSNVFTHFDYHIDNLIWLKNRDKLNRVGILDFQDALIAPPVYDLVSLLQDARRDVSENLQAKLINRYLRNYKGELEEFKFLYDCVGAQRNTRILGVFARLKLRDNKGSYLKYMDRVWQNLFRNLKNSKLKDLETSYEELIPEGIFDES